MQLTPFYVTGDFNIFDSSSNNTSDPAVTYSPVHDLTKTDIKWSLRA